MLCENITLFWGSGPDCIPIVMKEVLATSKTQICHNKILDIELYQRTWQKFIPLPDKQCS